MGSLLFRNLLKDIHQEIPYFTDRCYRYPFFRRMRPLDGWTKGNHLHLRIIGTNDTALQACMASLYLGFMPETLGIKLLHQFQYTAFRIRFPTRIIAGKLYGHIGQLCYRCELLGHLPFGGSNRRTREAENMQLAFEQ